MTFADDGNNEEAFDCPLLVKISFIQYATVWFSYEPKSVQTIDATLQRQYPATVTCSGGDRILEEVGPAAGPKVLW